MLTAERNDHFDLVNKFKERLDIKTEELGQNFQMILDYEIIENLLQDAQIIHIMLYKVKFFNREDREKIFEKHCQKQFYVNL